MKSSDLASYGFGIWSPFSKAGKSALIASLPVKPGMYATRCCREFARRIGSSDILYFGSATNAQGIKHRVRQYFSPGPTQRTNIRILTLIGDCADYELAFVATNSIPEAKMLEATLLEKYEGEHGELPPENRRR